MLGAIERGESSVSSRNRRPCAALFVTLAALGPAQAAVIEAAANGFTIENTIHVPTDADTAWRALVDDVGRWWPRDHTWWGEASMLAIDARAGGCFCERNGPQQAQHMLVTFVDPGKLLRMTGGLGPLQGMGLHGVLEFRFAPAEGGGTTITLFYRAGGYTPDDLRGFAPIVDEVQALQLGGLGKHLGAEPAQSQ
jgi:uncharacterized protein YndB with AHSA1/START domain